MSSLISNQKNARNAIFFVYLVLVLDAFNIIITYHYIGVCNNFVSGLISKDEMFLSIPSLLYTLTSLLHFFTFLISGISGIFFIIWFYNAYKNLHIKVEKLKYDKVWAIASWFVPIISIALPFIIMRELYKKTVDLLPIGKERSELENMNILSVWWFFWILSVIISFVIFLSINYEYISIYEEIELMRYDMILSAFTILSALTTLKVIKTYSNAEKIMFENKEENQLNFTIE